MSLSTHITLDDIPTLLAQLPISVQQPLPESLNITQVVDGRGLACPMPLLKTKVALRDTMLGSSVYVLATDPNSQADIRAFCQHSDVNLITYQQNQDNQNLDDTAPQAQTNLLAKNDTIFHFIITKTDSNYK